MSLTFLGKVTTKESANSTCLLERATFQCYGETQGVSIMSVETKTDSAVAEDNSPDAVEYNFNNCSEYARQTARTLVELLDETFSSIDVHREVDSVTVKERHSGFSILLAGEIPSTTQHAREALKGADIPVGVLVEYEDCIAHMNTKTMRFSYNVSE